MGNYENQKYFESLCKTYCITHRASKKEEKEQGNSRLWRNRKNSVMVDIERTIAKTVDNGQTFIITNAEEVFTLIKYYAEESDRKYPVININDEHKVDFPKGEIATKFYRAYLIADFDAICRISKQMEDNIW